MIKRLALFLILLQSGCMADPYAESFEKLEKKLDTIIERLDRADEKLETIAKLVSNEALVLSAGNQTELVSNEGQNFTSNYTSNWPVEALFLSYGNRTELIIPSTCDGCEMQTCTLPDISSEIRNKVPGSEPSERYYSHTVDGLFICGGGRTADHCLHFSAGSWNKSHSFPGRRWAHTSALVGEKLVLIGGKDRNTTDILDTRTGETEEGFELKHFSMWSCAMPVLKDDKSIIVTGGTKEDSYSSDGSPVVSLYTISGGWSMDLAPLNEGRVFHGCGSFIREDGTQVFMVAGGESFHTYGGFLSSTEALIGNYLEAGWKYMNPLLIAGPVSMATLGNRLYAVGLDLYIPGEIPSSIVVWIDEDKLWKRIKQFYQDRSTVSPNMMSTVQMTEELLTYC